MDVRKKHTPVTAFSFDRKGCAFMYFGVLYWCYIVKRKIKCFWTKYVRWSSMQNIVSFLRQTYSDAKSKFVDMANAKIY